MFSIENIRDFFTIVGIILVPAGWIYNQYQKRILDQYLSKEQKYQAMVRSADALLYEDFRHPEIQQLVYEFIKEFQACFLYVPDSVIRAGHEFLYCFEELLGEPEVNLSTELEEILLDDDKDEDEDETEKQEMLEKKVLASTSKKHRMLYEEYLNERQRELYQELRDKRYPEFIKAIRKDMMPRRTTLSNEEYISSVPPQIKISRHLKFVGKNLAHLILLLVEANKEQNLEKIETLTAKLVKALKTTFKNISYRLTRNNRIIIVLGDRQYGIIHFLDILSINEIFGFEKAVEIKKALERV